VVSSASKQATNALMKSMIVMSMLELCMRQVHSHAAELQLLPPPGSDPQLRLGPVAAAHRIALLPSARGCEYELVCSHHLTRTSVRSVVASSQHRRHGLFFRR
jgi:hypothetical protein